VEGGAISELCAALQSAIAGARSGEGAQLVHVKVPRLTGHNWQDPAAYKSAEEKAEDARRDPLARLIGYLQEQHGVTQLQVDTMREQATEYARQQAEAAWKQGHDPSPDDAL